jgi:hypothetical protein
MGLGLGPPKDLPTVTTQAAGAHCQYLIQHAAYHPQPEKVSLHTEARDNNL